MIPKLIQTLLLLLAIVLLFILKEAGVFRQILPHHEGFETILNTHPGVEDITIDLETNEAYLSSHDRRSFSTEGMIFKAKLAEDEIIMTPILSSELTFPFRPHGISLFIENDSTKYLFVVNHENELNSILRFRIQNTGLIFEKRFIHDLIKYPNDVQATGVNSFYLTNDHTIPNNFRRLLGNFVLEKSGNVVFYKDGNAAVVTQNMAYANGINLSQDKQFLYVAATTENKLYAFAHSQELSMRKLIGKKHLGTSPDNIEIDEHGDLWIACHPQLLKYLAHAKNKNKKSPSEIIRISHRPNSKIKFLQKSIYLNDGTSISGSSVAAFFDTDSTNSILIGSVFEKKVVKIKTKLRF